jgi:hypothetical protein
MLRRSTEHEGVQVKIKQQNPRNTASESHSVPHSNKRAHDNAANKRHSPTRVVPSATSASHFFCKNSANDENDTALPNENFNFATGDKRETKKKSSAQQ